MNKSNPFTVGFIIGVIATSLSATWLIISVLRDNLIASLCLILALILSSIWSGILGIMFFFAQEVIKEEKKERRRREELFYRQIQQMKSKDDPFEEFKGGKNE